MSAAFVILGCILFASVYWAVCAVVIAGQLGTVGRYAYLTILVGAAILAYRMTYHYVRFVNDNTVFHGWPVPVVVFQRQRSDSEWEDFVGNSGYVAWPMNFLLLMVLPTAISLGAAAIISRHRISSSMAIVQDRNNTRSDSMNA